MHRQVSVNVSLVTGQVRNYSTYRDGEGSEASIAYGLGALPFGRKIPRFTAL